VGNAVKKYLDHEETLSENMHHLYGIIIRQCTPSLQSTIKADNDYDVKSKNFDSLWLLKIIKKIMAGIDTKANLVLTLHEQLLVFFTTKQGQNELDDNYLNHFDSHLKNLELAGREHLFCSSQILRKDLSTASDDEINAKKECFKAMCFIL